MFFENLDTRLVILRSQQYIPLKVTGYLLSVGLWLLRLVCAFGLIAALCATNPMFVYDFLGHHNISATSGGVMLMFLALAVVWVLAVSLTYAHINRSDAEAEGGLTFGFGFWMAFKSMFNCAATYWTGSEWAMYSENALNPSHGTLVVQNDGIHAAMMLVSLAAAWYLTARLIALRPR